MSWESRMRNSVKGLDKRVTTIEERLVVLEKAIQCNEERTKIMESQSLIHTQEYSILLNTLRSMYKEKGRLDAILSIRKNHEKETEKKS